MPAVRLLLGIAVAIGGSCLEASAQDGFPNIRPPRANPPVSPYLSLLNRNNSMAFNYYELYRPQVEFREAYRQLNRNVSRLDSRLDQQEAAFRRLQLGATGHQTSFMNYGSYFPGLGR